MNNPSSLKIVTVEAAESLDANERKLDSEVDTDAYDFEAREEEMLNHSKMALAAEIIEERAQTIARAVETTEAIVALAVASAAETLSGTEFDESALKTLLVAKEAAAKTLRVAKEDATEVLAIARELAKELLKSAKT